MFPMGLQGHIRNPRRSLVSSPTSSWGNFSPLALNPLFWFDASDTTSITSSAGRVSQWDDKSGNARNATQATGTLQPTTGSTTQNGLNVLTFGLNRMTTSSFSFSGSKFTCFAVCRASTDSATNRQVIGTIGSNPTLWLSSGNWSLYATSVFSSTTAYDTNWHIFTGIFNGAASAIRLDGVEIATGNPGTASYTVGSNIGSDSGTTSAWRGDIAELISCPLLLSNNDLRVVETYLNAKWAVY